MKKDMELALFVTAGVIGVGLAAAFVRRCLHSRNKYPSPLPSPPSSTSRSPVHSEVEIVENIIVSPPLAAFEVALPPTHVGPPAAVPSAAADLATIITNVIAFFADLSTEIVRKG